VSCDAAYRWSDGRWAGIAGQAAARAAPTPERKLVAYDFGIKRNILRLLVEQGFDVHVVPASATADEVLALEPDAVFLSNGPAIPAAVQGIRAHVRPARRDQARVRICLGHQILGLALGGETRSSSSATTAATSPARTSRPARSRSAPRTTAMRSTPTRCAPRASPCASRT
jgi:carbamoyl-phosphate synthase small subunit